MDDFLHLYESEGPPPSTSTSTTDTIPLTYAEASSKIKTANLTRLWDENIKRWLTKPLSPPDPTVTSKLTNKIDKLKVLTEDLLLELEVSTISSSSISIVSSLPTARGRLSPTLTLFAPSLSLYVNQDEIRSVALGGRPNTSAQQIANIIRVYASQYGELLQVGGLWGPEGPVEEEEEEEDVRERDREGRARREMKKDQFRTRLLNLLDSMDERSEWRI